MEKFMIKLNEKCKKAVDDYNQLIKWVKENHVPVEISPIQSPSYVNTLTFNNSDIALSISRCEYGGVETLLKKKNLKGEYDIHYTDIFNYQDVKQFDDLEEIKTEILTLCEYFAGQIDNND